MKRMTSAVALIAASLLGLTACGSSDDPLASSSPTGSASASALRRPDRRRWCELLRVHAARRDLRRCAEGQGHRRHHQAQHRLARDLPARARGRLGAGVPRVHRRAGVQLRQGLHRHRPRRGLRSTCRRCCRRPSPCSTSRPPRTTTRSWSPRTPPTKNNLKTIDDLKAVAGDLTLDRAAGVQGAPAGHPRPREDLRRHLQVVPAAHRPGHRPGSQERPGRRRQHLLHRPGHRGQRLRRRSRTPRRLSARRTSSRSCGPTAPRRSRRRSTPCPPS